MNAITNCTVALASWQTPPEFQREGQFGLKNNRGHCSVKLREQKASVGHFVKAYLDLESKGDMQKAS